MKLKVVDGLIEAFAQIGELNGSVDYLGDLPEGFVIRFKPKLYKFEGAKIYLNENYVDASEPEPTLTQQDEINAQLFKMNLDLQKQLEEMRRVE